MVVWAVLQDSCYAGTLGYLMALVVCAVSCMLSILPRICKNVEKLTQSHETCFGILFSTLAVSGAASVS